MIITLEEKINRPAKGINERDKKSDMIVFDEDSSSNEIIEEQDIELEIQIQDDPPSSKFYEEKSKIEKRRKFQQYINERRSLGYGNNKNMSYDDENDPTGTLINQLGLISDLEKENREIELFILAFNKNPSHAINEYIKKGIISNDQPQSIAEYLIKIQGLDKVKLGEYFGQNNEKNLKILHAFCDCLKFQKVQFDKAIRLLLARFRLPGQSQQIQRIIEQFSNSYYQANSEQHKNADELFPLSYAIIMLATDAHNPKQQNKMSKNQFIKNTQGPCPSISSDYLSGIYDRITKQKFETQISYIETLYARLKGISSTDIQALLSLTKDLLNGDVFLKSCYNKKKFVQRKFYISKDEKKIEWICDPKQIGQIPRFIFIKDIVDLTLGLGSDVMKRNNVPKQFDSLCFTITTQKRTIDLKAKTNKERSKWVNYIRAILIKRREQQIQQLDQKLRVTLSHQNIEQIWNTEIFPNWDDHWDYKKKKPKQKNLIVRGFQAICGCFSKTQVKQSEFTHQTVRGLEIKSSILGTLWGLGLPPNSRKTLWQLIIGNNLAITQLIVEEKKKKVKIDPQLRKFTTFNQQVLEIAEFCRQFRPDIPPLRDLLIISQIFWKVFSKNQFATIINPLLNKLHLDHFLSFFRGEKSEIDLRIKLFEYLLEINAPKVKDHFEGLKLQTRMFLVNWLISIFYDCFSGNQQFLLRIWDNFILQGQLYLFKVGITLVKYYQIELKMCTFHEGLQLLRFPKNTSSLLFFKMLEQNINVKEEYYSQFIDKRKNAIIKTKVQSIPLQ